MSKLKIKITKMIHKAKSKCVKSWRILGPGFVTGAADDDPSGIGTYSIAGAKYGLLFAWLIPLQLPLLFAIQEMCARIGVATGKGLTANMKRIFSWPFLYLMVLSLVIANVANISADIAIMAASARLIAGGTITWWAIVIVLIIIVMEIFISYHVYSKVLLVLALFLLSYVITALMVFQDWSELLKHIFIPSVVFTKDFIVIATGFLGTTISPYLFFWQTSQEAEEKKYDETINNSKMPIKKVVKKMQLDTFIGMFFSQLVALFIVITCFSTLHKNGITEIGTAHDAAMALKPLAGEWAFLIFAIGIIGAGLLGIPILAGSAAYALSELFGRVEGLSSKFKDAMLFYGIIIFALLFGLFINFIGINPIKALLYASVINGFAAVPLIALIIILANKKQIMGNNTNGLFSNLLGWFTFGLMLTAAILFIVFV